MLGAYETPRHRNDWSEEVAALAERLRTLPAGTRPSAAEVSRAAAARVYATIPVRAGNAREEREVIENAVRFGTIGYAERLDRLLEPAGTLASLLKA